MRPRPCPHRPARPCPCSRSARHKRRVTRLRPWKSPGRSGPSSRSWRRGSGIVTGPTGTSPSSTASSARARRPAGEALPAGTIATVDAGPYRADVAEAWHAVAPRELLASNGLDSAGFALPAAIAAHLVHLDRRIVCFTGADELLATAGELDTARRLGVPVIVVVFAVAPGANDLIRIAESAQLAAFSAEGAEQFGEALSRAMHRGGPALITVTAPSPR